MHVLTISRVPWYVWVLASMIVAAAALAGCGSNGSDSLGAQQDSPTEHHDKHISEDEKDDEVELLARFEEMVKTAENPSDIFVFLDEHMHAADRDSADEMVRRLIVFQNDHLPSAQDAYFQSNIQETLLQMEWPMTKEDISSIEDTEIRRLVTNSFADGYKLMTAEGTIYPIIDYELLKSYNSSLSDGMKDYIDLLAMESNEPSAKDAALVISLDELVLRLLTAETFLQQHSQFPERKEVEQLYLDRYLPMYIYGLNNTPVFDFDTFKIRDEVKTHYEKFVKEHPDTITAMTVENFLNVLVTTDGQVFQRINGQQTDIPEVRAFHESFQDNAEELLKKN